MMVPASRASAEAGLGMRIARPSKAVVARSVARVNSWEFFMAFLRMILEAVTFPA
jgi:hypothetical protein